MGRGRALKGQRRPLARVQATAIATYDSVRIAFFHTEQTYNNERHNNQEGVRKCAPAYALRHSPVGCRANTDLKNIGPRSASHCPSTAVTQRIYSFEVNTNYTRQQQQTNQRKIRSAGCPLRDSLLALAPRVVCLAHATS